MCVDESVRVWLGGCRCGAVRYEARATALRSVVCACSDCQASSGSWMSVNVGVKPENFAVVRGEEVLARYTDRGGSGQNVDRFWCATCGSPLFARPESYPIVSLRAVTLDEPWKERPVFGIFEENLPSWLRCEGVSFEDDA